MHHLKWLRMPGVWILQSESRFRVKAHLPVFNYVQFHGRFIRLKRTKTPNCLKCLNRIPNVIITVIP